jgi:hypothetical protein
MSSQARTTIVDGLLFDGVSPLRAEATIVVEGENIMSITGPSAAEPGPADADSLATRIARAHFGGSPRALRAWPVAWPSPSGPLGRQRSLALSGALDAGGADPDNAGRSGLIAVTFSRRLAALDARVTSWWWCWSARQRDTAGTAGGRSPGVPCAAVAAP